MLWIVQFVFLCALLAPKVQGQISGILHEPNQYFTAVVNELWIKIKEHGISNLPVLDTSLNYNYTSFGVDFVGPVHFEDGFVQDIDSVGPSPHNFQWQAPLTHAAVTGDIAFENVRVYRDFRADFATGMISGSAIISPIIFLYRLNIAKEHGNDTVIPTLTFNTYNTLVWDMFPDNIETRLIRRQILNQTTVSGLPPSFLGTTARAWIPLFTQFINEIIDRLGFPDMNF